MSESGELFVISKGEDGIRLLLTVHKPGRYTLDVKPNGAIRYRGPDVDELADTELTKTYALELDKVRGALSVKER